jgi:hypothetical protein
MKGKKNSTLFAILAIWHKPSSHRLDYYCCLTKIMEHSKWGKGKMLYASISSAMKTVPHRNDLPIPKPPFNWNNLPSKTAVKYHLHPLVSATFPSSDQELHLIQQWELNDLVHDWNL